MYVLGTPRVFGSIDRKQFVNPKNATVNPLTPIITHDIPLYPKYYLDDIRVRAVFGDWRQHYQAQSVETGG